MYAMSCVNTEFANIKTGALSYMWIKDLFVWLKFSSLKGPKCGKKIERISSKVKFKIHQ